MFCAHLPSCFSLSHDLMSLCYRPSGPGTGAFPGIIARGVWVGEEVPTPWSAAELYMSPRPMQSPAWCLRGRSSPCISLAAGATGEHYQVSSHGGCACCDRGDNLQLHKLWVTRHLGDLGGKLSYARGAWQVSWAALASHNSGDVVMAQGLGVALPFLVLNGAICSHPNAKRWWSKSPYR